MPIPGDTLIKRFSLVDAVGAPITTASFAMSGRDPLGGPLTVPAPTHLGDGIYEVALPTTSTDATGHYYVQAVADDALSQRFAFEWLVTAPGTAERWKPGDTLLERITVIDHTGTPLEGVTFSLTGVGPWGRRLSVSPPIERGNGVYDIVYRTSPLDRPGSYYVQVRAHADPVQVFEVEWHVGRAPSATGHTLKRIRRMVLARFGDLVTAKATATGTETLFIDADTLVGEPSRFAGREILFTSGPNAGQMRYITGSSRNDSAVTLNRPLPYPTQEGDEADITNAYGIGVTFRAVHDAINFAIAVARDYKLTPVTYETSEPWDGTTDSIPVPMDMVGVERVEAIDDCDTARSITRASRGGGYGWSLDHSRHAVLLRGPDAKRANGWRFRITGYTLPGELTADDDTTEVDIEWLVDMATSHLCLDTLLSRQNNGEWGSKGMLYQQRADRVLSRLTPNIRSSFQRFL